MQGLPAAQVTIVGVCGCLLAPECMFLSLGERATTQRRSNFLGDFVLNGKDIAHLAFETLRPFLITGSRIRQLHGNA
jgi:hypothetical protein